MTTLSIGAYAPETDRPRGYAPPAGRRIDASSTLKGAGAAMFFLTTALAMTDYTGAAALVAAVAGLVTAIGTVLGNFRKQDAATIDTLVKTVVERELRRHVGGSGPTDPDSTEAEPEKPHGRRRKRPENRPPEV